MEPTEEYTPRSGCKGVRELLLSYREELYDLRLKYEIVVRRLEELEAVTGVSLQNTGDNHYNSSPQNNHASSSVPSFKSESTQQVPRSSVLPHSSSTWTGNSDCSRTHRTSLTENSPKEVITAKHEVEEWNCYEHSTMLRKGTPLGSIPKGATVFYISSETDSRHMFQPDFYSATHAESNLIYFSNEVNARKVTEGFIFHCQYFHENNIYFDFRVEAAKRLKSCQPIYSEEEWEEYFTVTTRYPRTSAFSTDDDVNWDNQMILALHGSAASTGSNTIFDYMHKQWNDDCDVSKKSQIVIREIVGDPDCILKWEVVPSDQGYIGPIKLIILPRNLKIFSKFISPKIELKPSNFVIQYGSSRKSITFQCDKGVAEFLKTAKQKFNARKLTTARTSKGDILNDERLLSLPDGSCIHVN
jgi:hypothetical protein